MPNLVELLGQVSLFAKLTMAVAIVAFGLAVAYVFRPTEQKLVLMRPVSLAAIFATVSGLLGGWIAVLAKHSSDAGWAPAGGESLSRHRRITHRRLRLVRPARRRLDACGGRRATTSRDFFILSGRSANSHRPRAASMSERRRSTAVSRVAIAVWKSSVPPNIDTGLSDFTEEASSVCHSRIRAASLSRS